MKRKNAVIETARELAARFYENSENWYFLTGNPADKIRSLRFRKTFPTLKHFQRGWQIQPDGSTIIDKPAWRYFEQEAYTRCVVLLGKKDKEYIHEQTYKDILEYRSMSDKLKTTQRVSRAIH